MQKIKITLTLLTIFLYFISIYASLLYQYSRFLYLTIIFASILALIWIRPKKSEPLTKEELEILEKDD
ncbi:MAG: hypothetical protein ACMXYF_03375 [Candidatus Woesearchaeota archaeon]